MNTCIAVLALIACVAADVSHLNRDYLPPVQHASGASTTATNAGTNAAQSHTASYNSPHQSLEYAQQFQEVPVLGSDPITYGNGAPQAPQSAASANDDTASYGSYSGLGNENAQVQYTQEAGQEPQQFDVLSANQVAGVDVGAGGGSYDLSGQDLTAQVLEYNNLLTDSSDKGVPDSEVDVDVAAQQGPQPVAQYVSGGASASSGIDTQYGANGGYIY